VAWVAERKDVLSTFFVMLTLWAYPRYVEVQSLKSKVQSRDKTDYPTPLAAVLFYLLALAFFALGLMSKPMVVTLPLVLLLLDYWPLKRFELATFVSRPSLPARLLMEKLPFVLAALLTSLITLHAANRQGWMSSAAQYPMTDRIANATLSYARYFVQVFWPANLAVYYPFPATFSIWSVGAAGLLLVGITVAAFCMARQWPYVVVGWLWYLATLLPVIGLIQLAGYSHADRYTYVPLIGLFVSLVWGAGELVRHWRRPALPCAVAAVAAAMLLCLARTPEQVGYWKESETLFRHALAVTKDNWLVHNNLGILLLKKGQVEEAISQYQEAIRLQPDYADAHDNLGNALARKGQIDEAITQYQEAIRLKPDNADAHNNLGTAFGRKGQMDVAITQFQAAIRLNPDYAAAHNNLGNALAEKGQIDEAISQYQEAILLKPDYTDAHTNLARARRMKTAPASR
jgi:Tfp pilus assembly protein PilF